MANTPPTASPLDPSAQRATPLASGWIDKVRTLITSTFEDSGIPNLAITIVHGGETVYLDTRGIRRADDPTPVDPETRFQLASCSKSISSTLVAALVGDGYLSWDSRMVDLIPGFALSDPMVTSMVTVADLYSHRSGLPDHAGDELEVIGFDRNEIIDALRHYPLVGDFRDSYAYTNEGLTAAAEGAARTTGKTFEDIADERLFAPLGMTRSSFRQVDWISDPNHAANHRQQPDGSWRVSTPQHEPDPQTPAGGASSTANDIAKWMLLQLSGGIWEGKQLIDPTALAKTYIPHNISSPSANPSSELPRFYGLGWNVSVLADGTVALDHSGAFTNGVATAVHLLPAHDLGIAVLTASQPTGLVETLSMSIADIALYGAVQRDWAAFFGPLLAAALDSGSTEHRLVDPANAAPPLDLTVYTGNYQHEVFGTTTVTEQNGLLTITLGPKPIDFPLTHIERDTFSIAANDEYWVASDVIFRIGVDGQAQDVLVTLLGTSIPPVFTRRDTKS